MKQILIIIYSFIKIENKKTNIAFNIYYMETVNEILNNFIKYFNTNNIPFVIGGGMGVKMLCELFSIPVSFDVNNLDIFYLANTPITISQISSYRRMTEPRTTTTYTTEDGFNINLTMKRNHTMNFIHYDDNIKIMHPKNLILYYIDEFDMTETMRFKHIILDSINYYIKMDPVYSITKQNTVQNEEQVINTFNTSSLARRLFAIQE